MEMELKHLIDGDISVLRTKVLKKINEGINFIDIYEKDLKPILYEVGELWANCKIDVATEHFASSLIYSLMNELLPNIINLNKLDKKILVTTCSNETHQIAAKMISDYFESLGWTSFYLPGETPIDTVVSFLKTRDINIVALSMTLSTNLKSLERDIGEIRKKCEETLILIGGQGFRNIDILKLPKGAIYLKDLYELADYMKGSKEKKALK